MTDAAPSATPSVRRRVSTLLRPALMRPAETEYDRFCSLLPMLDAGDWSRPTECSRWTVRAMVGQTLGMAEPAASLREAGRH